MSGSILKAARAHAKQIVTSGGFEVDTIITTPSGGMALPIKALASHHSLEFDSNGLPISGNNVHVTIAEDSLLEGEYPVRNPDNKVVLKNHLITFKGSNGVEKTWQVIDQQPNNTLGLIYLTLGEWS